MRFKKLISILSALTISFSMISAFTVAEAASLGGNVKVSAAINKFDKKTDTVAFVYVDVKVDMTEAEALAPYGSEMDEETWEEKIVGNGITTLGISYELSEGFTFNESYSSNSYGAAMTAQNIAITSISDKTKYITDDVLTFTLAFRVNPATSGTLTFNTASVDGNNSAENNKTWAYHTSMNNITLTNFVIPSCNDWLNPTPAGPSVSAGTVVDNVTEYTFENSTAMAGQKVLVTTAATTRTAITEDTRFYVSYQGAEPRIFGSDVWGKLAQGGGSISVDNIKFGIIVSEGLNASDFTFEVK